MSKQSSDPTLWPELVVPEGRSSARQRLLISAFFLISLPLLGGSLPGTTHREAGFQRLEAGWRQAPRGQARLWNLPSGSMAGQLYDVWEAHKTTLAWLAGFCALQMLVIAYLLGLWSKRRASEQRAAQDCAFHEIVAGIAAELIATPDCLATGEMKGWLGPFLHYFNFEWASLLELREDGVRAVPLYSSATPRVSPPPFRIDAELAETADVPANVVVLAPDPIMEKFRGLKSWLCRHSSYSFVILPLRVSGELLGVLVLASAHPKSKWPDEWTDELHTIANVFANTLKRKRTEDDLRATKELKQSILSSFASQVAVIDRTGKVLVVNAKWLRFSEENRTGPDPAISLGANYLVECERAAERGDIYARQALLGIKAVIGGQREYFEMAYPCHSSDQQRWFTLVVTPLTRAEGGAVIKRTDITESKIAESRLRESETRFRLLADTAPVMIWMSGLDRLCTYFNQGWLDFTGRTLHQELGNGWVEGVHPDDVPKCLQSYVRAFDGRQKFSMEYRLRRADGQYRWIIDSGAPRFLSDGTFSGYIGCCFDITDRKELAITRMEFSGRLIKAQEEERARIARELHDDIGQRLALLAIDVQQLDAALYGTNQDVHGRMQALWSQINEIATDAGRISHQLHSSKLQLLGLAQAVRGLCDDFSKQYAVNIDYSCTGVPPHLDSAVSLSLFRVAQEALHNAARHSHAQHVRVRLRGNTAQLRLSIHDDGRGFDVDTALAGEGLGLISMTERLRLVGGAVSIRSDPSYGTRVVARVPLRALSLVESTPGQQSHDTAA